MLTDLFKRKVFVQCLDYFKDPVAIIDGLSRIAELNSAFCGLFDIERAMFIGKPFSAISGLQGAAGAIKGCLSDQARGTGQIKLGGGVWSWVVYPIHPEGRAGTERLCGIQFQDVTRHIELEEELAKGNRLLTAVNTISTAFIYSDEISSVFEKLIDKVRIVTDMPVCWIVVKSGEKLTLRGAAGVSRDSRMKLEEGALDGFHNAVMSLGGEPFHVLSPGDFGKYPWFPEERILFLVAQPLSVGGEKAGVLATGSREPVSMGFDLAALIHLVGNHVSLVIEKVRLYEEARRLAVTDALTGLFNIRYFYDSMALEAARAKRYGTRFSVTILDLDDFKAINDTFGHQIGDEVLKKVALIMKNASRETDIVARYGGEEFVIIQANTSKAEALAQVMRVKNAVESEYYIDRRIRVSLSGGIATCPEDGEDGKRLLYSADMALYEAKAMGKKQIRLAGGRDEKNKNL
ncbi:MAG: sensor domain-containing diguanylate cyclase [Nitrospiraceae bacterium]|nr:sensor domain-containing diguanylate cyclase [Nitrospiraceae bacterium]